MIKVKDLIERLQALDPELEVMGYNHEFDEFEPIEDANIQTAEVQQVARGMNSLKGPWVPLTEWRKQNYGFIGKPKTVVAVL